MAQSDSHLFKLPWEVRNLIWTDVLKTDSPTLSFGPRSGLSAAFLSTCRAVYEEAQPLLFSKPHTIILAFQDQTRKALNPSILQSFQDLTIIFYFGTADRGDCETYIEGFQSRVALMEVISLALMSSQALRRLHITLCNVWQRKKGPQSRRSGQTLAQMKDILLPFAFFDKRVKVTVGGFDAIDYVEMFEDLREMHEGRDIDTLGMVDGIRGVGASAGEMGGLY